jgi:hypothetical protein
MVGSKTDPNDSLRISSLVLSTTLSSAGARHGGTAARPQTRTPSTAITMRKRKRKVPLELQAHDNAIVIG